VINVEIAALCKQKHGDLVLEFHTNQAIIVGFQPIKGEMGIIVWCYIVGSLVLSVSDQSLTIWHGNYPLHLTYVCTLSGKVTRVKSVTGIV